MNPTNPLFTKYTFGSMHMEDLFEMWRGRESPVTIVANQPPTAQPTPEPEVESPPASSSQPSSRYTVSSPSETLNADSPSSKTSDYPNKNKPVYLVFQHSQSASNSALLPVSNVVGVYNSREHAMVRLHSLKREEKPVVKGERPFLAFRAEEEVPKRPRMNFWCTSEGEVGDECGYRYTTPGGEEFVVWIEEHEVK